MPLNTVRNVKSDAVERSPHYRTNSVQRAINVNNQAVPFSRLEKGLVLCIGIVLLILMLSLVNLRTANAQQQRQIQDVSSKTQTVISQNTTLRQEISELSSSSRLLQIAKEHNFNLRANNIRNISK